MTAGRSPVELLDTLDALRAKATPGPWRAEPNGLDAVEIVGGGREGIRDVYGVLDADAACIVAEHNAVPALVAALRAVLELADEIDAEAQGRWARTLQARGEGDRDAAFGERGAGDALHDASLRIRAAVAAALAPEGGQAE